MPAHQVLPLTAYIFEAIYSTSASQELLTLWAGIEILLYYKQIFWEINAFLILANQRRYFQSHFHHVKFSVFQTGVL